MCAAGFVYMLLALRVCCWICMHAAGCACVLLALHVCWLYAPVEWPRPGTWIIYTRYATGFACVLLMLYVCCWLHSPVEWPRPGTFGKGYSVRQAPPTMPFSSNNLTCGPQHGQTHIGQTHNIAGFDTAGRVKPTTTHTQRAERAARMVSAPLGPIRCHECPSPMKARTFSPWRASRSAATKPLCPPPTMTTSDGSVDDAIPLDCVPRAGAACGAGCNALAPWRAPSRPDKTARRMILPANLIVVRSDRMQACHNPVYGHTAPMGARYD